MKRDRPIKPTDSTIRAYHEALEAYGRQGVLHEGAVRSAFQNLLAEYARRRGWVLIPELSAPGQRRIVPDGTLRDENSLPRGYWEAKDSRDDLKAEIAKKTALGYPLTNSIFEDTRQAILFQDKQSVLEADLQDAKQVAELLNQFFSYKPPDIAGFEEAVDEFKQHVPELALGLNEKIKEAHRSNQRFIAAFDSFFKLCQTALNPNIRAEAVDEMLIQHLLTERLIGSIFDKPEFVQQNVIAAEVEKVVSALVSQSFSRKDYLKSLDRFYLAIESAARTLPDFSDKQHFLNTVYERFFQGYSVKVADTHGIVYTPQPIVDFMCASVAEVLEREFGKSLSSPDVYIIDPCTGTGNFIVNLLRRMAKRDLPRVYRQQMFANEVMLLPYYIAALNIEHAYYEMTGVYEPFEGLCFVDTLDLSKGSQAHLYVTEKNAERVERQRRAPITVVIGNPPYNMNQQNENDNNKNRKYAVIDERVSDSYAKDSAASNKGALSDPYVKFFRWATDRLEDRNGIMAFVSNNSLVDQQAFDGMRKNLLQDFTEIYHIDLHGNVRRNPKLSGTTHNVFGIRVGVGITLAVRKKGSPTSQVMYCRVPEQWRKEEKLSWLNEQETIGRVAWEKPAASAGHSWGVSVPSVGFDLFLPIATKEGKQKQSPFAETIFRKFSRGLETCRDEWTYDFAAPSLEKKVKVLVENYNGEIDRWRRADKPEDIDSFVSYDPTKIKWCSRLKQAFKQEIDAKFQKDGVKISLYRPYTKRFVYIDQILTHRRGVFPEALPNATAEQENRIIWVKAGTDWPFFALASDHVVDVLPQGGSQCFPFYVYNEDGTNRRENISNWALEHFRLHYGDKTITKWDIFYYVYGVLNHPAYREKFAENLKRELPRIPLIGVGAGLALPSPETTGTKKGTASRTPTGPVDAFRAVAKAGRELADLHINYESLEPFKLDYIENRDVPLSYKVGEMDESGKIMMPKMRLSKDKTSLKINPSLTLAGIPPETFEYRLGNRSALDWVIDQYQVTENKASGIRSDPNQADDSEYIVRLVGQVVRVSLETVKIVKSLPAL